MSTPGLSQAEFLEQMRLYMIANQDRISDFNNGGAIDTQFNAFATQLNQVQNKSIGGFKEQFEQLPFQAFDFQRKSETTGSGSVVFSRPTADLVEIEIPIGTIVSTVTGLLYITQDLGTIVSGSTDSNAVNVIAEESGSDYNMFAGNITIIVSSVPDISSVTNNIAISGGTDKETNSQYFARFSNFILGLSGSNRYGIFTAAVGVETIQSAYILDHFPPKSPAYNFTVYVDDGSGSVPSSKTEEVRLVLYGNGTSLYQGYGAAGINFDVLPAGLRSIDVEYEITIDSAVTDSDVAKGQADDQITNYINNLWIGSDVIWSEVNKLIKSLNGILDVVTLTLNDGTANIITTTSQVARVNSITGTTT